MDAHGKNVHGLFCTSYLIYTNVAFSIAFITYSCVWGGGKAETKMLLNAVRLSPNIVLSVDIIPLLSSYVKAFLQSDISRFESQHHSSVQGAWEDNGRIHKIMPHVQVHIYLLFLVTIMG